MWASFRPRHCCHVHFVSDHSKLGKKHRQRVEHCGCHEQIDPQPWGASVKVRCLASCSIRHTVCQTWPSMRDRCVPCLCRSWPCRHWAPLNKQVWREPNTAKHVMMCRAVPVPGQPCHRRQQRLALVCAAVGRASQTRSAAWQRKGQEWEP